MSPKRNQCRKTNKPSTAGTGASAIENCVFPPNVMVSVLTRLHVKSILRFKSVCKPWCKLFATPRFVKLHHAQFSENPENMSVIIYSLSDYHDHTMSLFRIDSDENKPVTLDHPYPEIFFRMDFVGSCNGLVCMGCPPLGQCIVLWNPAMKLFKIIRLSKAELGAPEMVSLGFGYDNEGDDFKVVRIVQLKRQDNKMRVEVEVYSTKSDSWRTMKLGFQFNVMLTKNDAVVNGNPHWVVKVDENVKVDPRNKGGVVVYFDVKKMVFRVVPLPVINHRRGTVGRLVDWKGSLGFLVFGIMGEERVESLDVWVHDGGIWGKHAFGPVDLKVDRFLQCLKNGMFLGEFQDGMLFVYDPETGLVKEVVIDGARRRSFVIEVYAESLACIEGMDKVVLKTKEGEVVKTESTQQTTMPPKPIQCRKTIQPSSALKNRVFPQEVIVNILTRLPVKSILRFKAVCKPWFNLFATPMFMKMHHTQFSKKPDNQSIVIYSLSDYHDHTMSLLKIESDEKKPITLDHPYPEIFFRMDFVGSYNGLVCMGCPPLGQCIVLWNPAMKLFKMVSLSKVELGVPELVSLGFGYDDERDDFKVVRVFNLKKKRNKIRVGVEVYSSISDSWRTIKCGFSQFNVLSTKNDAIVNGNPYWVAKVDENVAYYGDLGGVVVCFDVKKMVFRVVLLPSIHLPGVEVLAWLVDWKDSLGLVVCGKNLGDESTVESLDVWVQLDDQNWVKKHTCGPIDLKVDWFLKDSKYGKILGERDGKLFVYDPETRFVREIEIDGAQKGSFEIDGYEESLACIKGMEKVVVKNEGGNEDGDDGSSEGEVAGVDVGCFVRTYLQHVNAGHAYAL